MGKLQEFFKRNPFIVILVVLMIGRTFQRGFSGSIADYLLDTLYILPGILVGLTVHEFAHAFAAYKLGDETPKLQGRVTLNPISHIDPVGLFALIFFHFGWGKPVQVNPFAFKKNARLCNIVVDLAGVTTNFLLGVLFGGIVMFFASRGYTLDSSWMMILYYAMYINFVLMIFNLLPIPPLDGFGVVTEIFDLRKKSWYLNVYTYGNIVLLVIILTGSVSYIFGPVLNAMMKFVSWLWGNLFF